MLNLTERQLQITKFILNGEGNITTRSLSEIYKVSTRQVRYDLDRIEYDLKKQGLELIKNRTSGIRIEGNAQSRQSLLAVIQTEEMNLDFPCLVAALLLLYSTSTVMKLANELQVGRNKIMGALPKVEKILRVAGLTLDKRPSIGMQLVGEEFQIRMAKFKLNPLIGTGIENYFAKKRSQYHEEKIIAAMTTYQKETGVAFSDQGSKELILTLCYQQLRISQGYGITYDIDVTKEAIFSEDFELIRSCFLSVGLNLTVEETIFVLHQIRNTQVVYLPDSKKNQAIHQDARQLAREFASLISERLGVDFVGNASFLNGLKLHLHVALHRMRSHQVIKNPLTEQIRYKYRFIFETCKQVIIQLEQGYQLNFPDDEIAYVAMHVSACFEMVNQTGLMPKALVVCHSGLATSNLLATRLKVMLPELSILGPLGASELKSELMNDVDFVISTIALQVADKDLIVVHPLLGIDDVLALKKRVINVTSQKQLSHLLLDTPADDLELGDLLVADQMKLQKRAASWRLAIEMAAQPLVENNSIHQGYVKAMIEAVENFGPYMVFIPDVAVVHASPSAGVIKEGLSILTLAKPVVLGDRQGASVSCFIVLATVEKESQLFMKLMRLLDHQNNVNQLLSSTSVGDMLQMTNKH